jgi:ADP-heptose:LPS heptosyltransferase
MHLAASVGTVCVSIFSARNRPGIWFPFGNAHEVIYHKTDCFGCNLEVCTIEKKKCILSISVDEVVAAARRARDRNLTMARR